jgi:hypothetical protein
MKYMIDFIKGVKGWFLVAATVYWMYREGEKHHWDGEAFLICAWIAAPWLIGGTILAVMMIRENRKYKRQLESGELFKPEKMGVQDKAWERYKEANRDK